MDIAQKFQEIKDLVKENKAMKWTPFLSEAKTTPQSFKLQVEKGEDAEAHSQLLMLKSLSKSAVHYVRIFQEIEAASKEGDEALAEALKKHEEYVNKGPIEAAHKEDIAVVDWVSSAVAIAKLIKAIYIAVQEYRGVSEDALSDLGIENQEELSGVVDIEEVPPVPDTEEKVSKVGVMSRQAAMKAFLETPSEEPCIRTNKVRK